MSDQTVGIPWYRKADYPRLKSTVFADGDQLPATYTDWLEETEGMEAAFERQGVATIRAYIEPAIFQRYCAVHGLNCDAAARKAFAKLAVLQGLEVDRAPVSLNC